MQLVRMLFGATTIFVLIAVVAALWVWGISMKRMYHRRVGNRFPVGTFGIIPGAEPLTLTAPGAAMGVVVLHGFGDTPQTVAALARQLRESGFDVSAPLLPGHGRTLQEFASSNGSEWLASAREAYAAMRARHAKVALVGLSMGGALAATLAADDPALAALVLLAPYIDAPPLLRLLVRAAPAIGVVMPYVGGAGTQSIHDPAARAEALAYGATTPQLVRELVRAADAARAALPRVTAPTLYMQSKEDNRITESVARNAFALLGARTKKLEMLEGCGHVLTVDYCREKVATMVIAWLRSVERGDEKGTA
ncbi:MAG TPA: alpha/beta fold hydrolase [Gemmatimonadaceae bacterium]|nr:alpha/beta fold hydrolase [Gemmatimonadaceae bacterium]